MFGRKRSKLQEQIKEVFSQIHEQREQFESTAANFEEGEKRIQTDICQVIENTSKLSGYAAQNIEEETALLSTIGDFSQDLKTAADEYEQLSEMIEKHYEAVTALVEENKHYTTPSKYLTETPAAIRQNYQSYETQLDEMAENSRKMSIMALNSAIEAGRMGESGKQFVASSEEIRQAALDYEKAALSMKEDIKNAQAKINELEDVIHRMVSLIKEGNKATTRLLKKSQELDQKMKESSMRDFSVDLVSMRDKVIGMRNLDEEISKCSERNNIQLGDIQEESLKQQNDLMELESDLSQLFDLAEEQVH